MQSNSRRKNGMFSFLFVFHKEGEEIEQQSYTFNKKIIISDKIVEILRTFCGFFYMRILLLKHCTTD